MHSVAQFISHSFKFSTDSLPQTFLANRGSLDLHLQTHLAGLPDLPLQTYFAKRITETQLSSARCPMMGVSSIRSNGPSRTTIHPSKRFIRRQWIHQMGYRRRRFDHKPTRMGTCTLGPLKKELPTLPSTEPRLLTTYLSDFIGKSPSTQLLQLLQYNNILRKTNTMLALT